MDRLESIEIDLKEIKKQVNKHDIACEVHAPMAKEAHDAMGSMSVMMSNLDMKVNALHSRYDSKDEADAIFQTKVLDSISDLKKENRKRDIAEAKAEGKRELAKEIEDKKLTRRRWIIGLLTPFAIMFMSWIVLSIQEVQVKYAKITSDKAINRDHKHIEKTKLKQKDK